MGKLIESIMVLKYQHTLVKIYDEVVWEQNKE